MSTRLPEMFHTPPEVKLGQHDVVIEKPVNASEVAPLAWRREALGVTHEVAYQGITPLGYGEVIRAYRTLRLNGEEPTEEAIAQVIYADETFTRRFDTLQQKTFETPEWWFDGNDNSCEITDDSSDRIERRLLQDFNLLLFRSRVGLSSSSSRGSTTFDFSAQEDWRSQGLGVAGLPFVRQYFENADISFKQGFRRIPLPGHPDATPSDGFGHSNTLFINMDDLPDPEENVDAHAESIAARAINFFRGPQFPEVETDPKFAPLILAMQEDLAEIMQMQVEGANRDEMRTAAHKWQEKHGADFHGERVTIIPKTQLGYGVSGSMGYGISEPHTHFEGYMARNSIYSFGNIMLAGSIQVEAKPDFIPEVYHNEYISLGPLFSFDRDAEGPIVPERFEPGFAITAPSDRDLPRPDEFLESWPTVEYIPG